MHRRTLFSIAITAAVIVTLGSTAKAAPGYVVEGVNLRAGPDLDYPVVAQLPPGTPTEIFGCLPAWTWCDIAVDGPGGGTRGWAAGVALQVIYDNQPASLEQYGPVLGLPLVGFDIGTYWGRYYRDRPFYGAEDRWRGRGYGGGGSVLPFNGGGFGRGPGEVHGGGPAEPYGFPGGPPRGFPPGPPGGFGPRGPVGNAGGPPPGARGPEAGPPGGFQRSPPPHAEPARPGGNSGNPPRGPQEGPRREGGGSNN